MMSYTYFNLKNKNILTIFLSLFIAFSTFAETHKNPPTPGGKKEVESVDTITTKIPSKSVMHAVFNSFTKLIPYMSDPESFNAPENETILLGHITSIGQAFQLANHSLDISEGGFRPSLTTMQEHLKSITLAFSQKHKSFALARLKATTGLCISCHSQLPKEKNVSFALLASTVNRSKFKSDFEYAEYLFVVRNYSKAIQTYLTAIDETLKTSQNAAKKEKDILNLVGPKTRVISDSIKQILYINLKVSNTPNKALALLEDIETKKSLPDFIKNDIKDYKEELAKLNQTTLSEIKNESELGQFINQHLEKTQIDSSAAPGKLNLKMLIVSGILQRYLNLHHNSNQAPKIFYWLAIAERPQSQTVFYNLADIYLKECVRNYSKHEYAKKCLERYEEEVAFGYTGSSGTNIPEEDKEEIKELHKLIHH